VQYLLEVTLFVISMRRVLYVVVCCTRYVRSGRARTAVDPGTVVCVSKVVGYFRGIVLPNAGGFRQYA
jgi:hypothetical protein